jgi:hypothetical protein
MMKKQFLTLALTLPWLAGTPLLAAEVPMPNSGFEDDFKTWTAPTPKLKDNISISSDTAHTGSKSLRLSSQPNGNTGPMLFRTVQGIQPNGVYYLSAWVRSTEATSGSIAAGIKLEYYNAKGQNTSGVNGRISLVPSSDWAQVTVTARADADTRYVKIYARQFGNGTLHFDDFQLEKPDVQLLDPTRLLYVPGQPVDIDLKVWTGDRWKSDSLPTFSLEATHDGKATTYQPQVKTVNEQEFVLSTQLPAINSGAYVIKAFLNGTPAKSVARTYPSVPNRKPANLTETGTILHQGKPFFPIGIYHPQNYTWYKVGGTDNTVNGVREDYKRIAEMGFNAVQGSSDSNLDSLGEYLDEAHKNGLVVDVPFYSGGRVKANQNNSLQKIARFKDHPAVLNWKISDEPDLRPAIVEEVPEAYHAFKKADPNTPIEVTLATDDALASWANFMDIIQINRYPVPGSSLTRVSDYTRLAVQNKLPWQNVSYVVQSGWVADLSNQPTVPQARSMVYLALIEGAKGIWWYSMYDPNWDLTKTPLWPHMKAINAEIKELSEPVMLGQHITAVTSTNKKVFVRTLKHEGKLYVLVTNPESTPQKTTLTLPAHLVKADTGKTLDGNSAPAVTGAGVALDLAEIDSQTLVWDLNDGR